jgi:hypothetical protein
MGPPQTSSNTTEEGEAVAASSSFIDIDMEDLRLLAANVYQAHKQALEEGLFDWSLVSFLRYKAGYVVISHIINR